MGLPRDRVDSAIRISFSRFNTITDIDELLDALDSAVSEIRKVK